MVYIQNIDIASPAYIYAVRHKYTKKKSNVQMNTDFIY